jgi:DNA segregation ATPase FtsK/SpoIIIE, S-DNA-T family
MTGTAKPDGVDGRDGKNLRIMANLQYVLDLKRIHALIKFEYDGPQLRVYRCAPRLDVAPERIERLAGTFAQAAYVTDCHIERADNGTLLIELAKPEEERYVLPAPGPGDLPVPRSTAVPIGLSSAGAPVWLDVADERHTHTLICGTTGSGKSVCLRWLLYRLLSQNNARAVRVLMLDPKRELEAFAGVPHLLHPPAGHPLEIARLLSWAIAELDRRIAARTASPRLVIVAEEIADLVLIHPAIATYLTRIAQVGRSAGINLIGTAQQPNVEMVGRSTVNFTARIVGRVASAALAYAATGQAGVRAEKLQGRGDMLFISGAGATRIQVPLCGEERLRELPRVERPASLASQLPALGGPTRPARPHGPLGPGGARGDGAARSLSPTQYESIRQDLLAGASVDQLQARYGIGYERARRMHAFYRRQHET